VEQYNGSGSGIQRVFSPTGSLLAQMNGSALQTAYADLPGNAVARYTSAGLGYYLHADWLGTTRLLSTPTRSVAASIAYAPFGQQYIGSGMDSFWTGAAHVNDEAPGVWTFPARTCSRIKAAGWRRIRRD